MSPRPDLGPKPRLGYTGTRVDRAAERRGDIAALKQDANCRFYAIGSDTVVMKNTAAGLDPLFAPAETRDFAGVAETVFLGRVDGAPRFAIALDAATIAVLQARDDIILSDLRSIAVRGLLDTDHLPLLAEGKALLGWHARHRFCPNCGAPTQPVEAGWRRDCANCVTQHFPRTDPVAIMLAIDGERCLLGRSHRFQAGAWSCLAGFIEPGETIEDAVRREVHEEAGIVCGRVDYFASQPWPFPSSLMIGCHAQALTREITIDRTELADARWFEREEVALMLARAHPEELTAPQPVAIAYHILRAWLEDGVAFD
jgi:NAD+ diphosphatase